MGEWEALVPLEGNTPVSARLCVVRKSQTAIALAHKKLRRYASKHGTQLQPETLLYAQYVMVLTTFPKQEFSLQQVLERYRFRWQIEMVFKRFKQIAQLGHLPKYDEDSAKAWLYGKLFVTLLTEKLIRNAGSLSPGDSSWHANVLPSRWREFSFAFHQITKALERALALSDMLANWNQIAKRLAEAPRKRKSQEQAFAETS